MVVTVHTRRDGVWTQTATIPAPPNSASFGDEIAMSRSGDVIVVGDQNAADSGQVSVLTRNGSNWNEPVLLQRPAAAGTFGATIAVSGDGRTIVVGDPTSGDNRTGRVAVFRRPGTTWSAGTFLQPAIPATTRPSRFGTALAISSDGFTIVIGDRNVEPNGFVSAYRAE